MMKLSLYAVAVGIALTILIVGATRASAQPAQVGGGAIYGWVYGFTWDDQLVPLEWVPVTAINLNASTFPAFVVSTGVNGTFGMYVPSGTYNVTVSPPGYKGYSRTISVYEGSSSQASFYLEQSHVPVPEFPTEAISIILVMAVAVTLLRRPRSRQRAQSKISA
jgi:hypothetical protein